MGNVKFEIGSAIYTVELRDEASAPLHDLTEAIGRLRSRLSDSLCAQLLEPILELSERTSGLLRSVSDDRASTALARDNIVTIRVSERLRDLAAALLAFDRDLEVVLERHGVLLAEQREQRASVESMDHETGQVNSVEARG